LLFVKHWQVLLCLDHLRRLFEFFCETIFCFDRFHVQLELSIDLLYQLLVFLIDSLLLLLSLANLFLRLLLDLGDFIVQ